MIIHNATSAHNFETVSARMETYGATKWLNVMVDGQVICSLFPSAGQVEYLQKIADAVADVNLAEPDEEPVNFRDAVQSTLSEQWGR